MTPSEIVSSFVDRINAHDLDGVCGLMEQNHVFIDGLGSDPMTFKVSGPSVSTSSAPPPPLHRTTASVEWAGLLRVGLNDQEI